MTKRTPTIVPVARATSTTPSHVRLTPLQETGQTFRVVESEPREDLSHLSMKVRLDTQIVRLSDFGYQDYLRSTTRRLLIELWRNY